MKQEAADSPQVEAPRPVFEWTRWKIVTFSLAGLLIAVGVITAFAGTGASPSADTLTASGPVGAVPAGPGANRLLPGSVPSGPTEPGETTEPGGSAVPPPAEGETGVTWSPALLRGGISFFAAFALAFAFRSFLKIALILVGIWAGAMFYFSYLGWIEVHWDVIDAAFNAMTANVGEQFKSVQTFITGSLPSAGMGGLGLYTGFRRK